MIVEEIAAAHQVLKEKDEKNILIFPILRLLLIVVKSRSASSSPKKSWYYRSRSPSRSSQYLCADSIKILFPPFLIIYILFFVLKPIPFYKVVYY